MKYEDETYPLEALYQEMREGRMSKRELEEAIFQFIFKNLGRYGLWYRNKDDCMDFVCSTYPLISASIDRYRDTGSSFDAYIAAQLRYARRREADRKRNTEAFEEVYGNDGAREFEVREKQAAYRAEAAAAGPDKEEEKREAEAKKVLGKRQAIFALLKAYYFAGDDLVRKVAAHAEVSEEYLHGRIQALKEVRESKEWRHREALRHAHGHYYRCLAYERKMRDIDSSGSAYRKLAGKLERGRVLVEKARKRLARIRTGATSREIAEVLGTSKGSVDSALFVLRRKTEEGATIPSPAAKAAGTPKAEPASVKGRA